MLYEPWRITLLGALTVCNHSHLILRFRTRQSALLLAWLAYFPERPQSREELADRLWPEAVPETSRVNLRVALSSLRRQLEPPGIAPGSVLAADRSTIRLRPESFTTDVAAFQAALRPPAVQEPPAARRQRLSRAAASYCGEFLPGIYDDWVLEAREVLAAQYRQALGKLLETQEALGDDEAVRECADRLIAADPLEEQGFIALMRLALQSNEPAQALREFERLETVLRNELGAAPSEEACRIAETARAARFVSSRVRQHSQASVKPPPAAPVSAELPSPVPEPPKSPRALPLSWTRFFGREAEQAALLEWLNDGTRLVTVTGPGGAGKTRLATETARRLSETFPGPVCFVPLADVLSAPLLSDAVAAGLRLSTAGSAFVGNTSPLEQIAEALTEGPALLILDNLEQIADGAAPFLQALLTRLPALRCLVTSRRSLHLPGERVLPLPPLPTPCHAETPERLLGYAGVQLFVDRAQAVRPDFQITPRNADAVSALCDRLEGLPLALELAAAWTGALTPAQALARLDERFALLVSRKPDAVKRHRTMHAAIAWSFDLLPADLRDFWIRLSVFRGGWTVEAAEAVCRQPDALEPLQRLRERSLILSEEAADGVSMRFRMLESLREFACDQREDADETENDETENARTQHRHARFFLDLVEVKQLEMTGAGAKTCLDLVEAEHANIAAALEWYDRPGADPEMGLRVAGALWRFWSIRGPLKEGRFRLEQAIARASGDLRQTDMAARAWNGLAVLARMQGNLAEACVFNQNALVIWRHLEDARGIAASLNNIGSALMLRGDLDAAQPLLEESLALWRRLGKPINVAGTLQNLGFLAGQRDDLTALDRLCAESLTLYRREGDQHGTAQVQSILASAAIKRQEFPRAVCLASESLQIAMALGSLHEVVNCLDVLAEAASKSGDVCRSAMLLGSIETLALTVGVQRDRPEEARIAAILSELSRQMGEQTLSDTLASGRAMTLDEAVTLALNRTEKDGTENPQSVQ